MADYAIYGAGAMGTVLGAYLTKAGIPVDLITRNEEHVAVLKEKGATVIGKAEFTQKVNALTPDEMTKKYDVVFLMTKQKQNKEIASFLKDKLKEDGVVCTLQNGMPEFSVAEALGEERTYGCAVAWGATFHGAGVSELTSEKRSFALGGLCPKREKLEEIASVLSKMGEVTIENNLLGARFSKLTVNAAFSGLSTVTGENFGFVYRDRRTSKIALAVIDECIRVADAAGITPEPIQGHDLVKVFRKKGLIGKIVASVALKLSMKHHKDLVSGMLMDIKKGRKCDIDHVNGVICSLGKKYGVETPYNDTIVEIVHGIENGLYELTKENVAFFVF